MNVPAARPLDMVTHYADLLNWYFGEPESTSARALMLEKTLPRKVKPVDYVSAILTYKNGVFCGIESSYQRYGVAYDTMEIYGDEYTAITDYRTLKLYRKKETVEFDVGFGEIESEQLEQAKNFCGNAVRWNPAPDHAGRRPCFGAGGARHARLQ